MTKKVRIAIAGLGNCASALVQGLEYYKNADARDYVPGIMHVKFGEYHISDVEVVAAFEVSTKKIGKDISEAIWAKPNCCAKFSDVPNKGVTVQPGHIEDGVAPHMKESFHCYDPKEITSVNIADALKESQADVLINFLPVGSEIATQKYAQAALDSNVAFANGIPAFIASNTEWAQKFTDKKIPVAGDDIKSQLGATILHRMLVSLAHERGIKMDETFQLNIGGNTDFENMKKEYRLTTKRISKTEAVTSMIPYEVPTRIGPSDYVPFLNDEKICYLWLKGKNFGEQPLKIQLKLSVQDSPNSAGVMIDVIRSLKIAKDRGIGGPLVGVSSYFFKHPPKQIPDSEAFQLVEKFIRGDRTN